MAEVPDIRARLPSRLIWERQFLKLAGVWIACRWEVMGNLIPEKKVYYVTTKDGTHPDLAFALLGCVDYQHEMKLQAKKFLDLLRC